jgi:hypothetical protein
LPEAIVPHAAREPTMSENAWKSIQNGLNVLILVVVALVCASLLGWIAPGYRSVLSNVFLVLLFATLAASYVKNKEARSSYRTYALWAVVISIPMLALAFMRDYWMNAWFQSTLFPTVFGPVMIATILGYGLLAFLVFRSMRRA